MREKWFIGLLATFLLSLGWSSAWAAAPESSFANATWTTVLQGVGGIEGLTGDDDGNFYVADRATDVCNVWKIDTNTVPATVSNVGAINQTGCRPSGLAFGPDGALYITSPAEIYRLTPNVGPNPAELYAEGVPGANGVAFLGNDLFVSDGTQNQGRVWKITGAGADCTEGAEVNCVEFFRIQARRNSMDLGGNVDPLDQPFGVGSERYTVPRHQIDTGDDQDRQAITANGLAFSRNGKTLYVADTSRGAIWAAQLDKNGNLLSDTGCDPTFNPNTLCMDSLYVAHPLLEGIDGIALDRPGNIYGSVNERNAIVIVKKKKAEVVDAFQNPADATTFLRNGDPTTDPPRPLEFPTSPFLSGKTFCTTGADSPRRDNNPNGTGEGPKVTCLDQQLKIKGLPLPIQ